MGAVTLTSWVAASLFLTVTPVFALSATCGTVTLSQGTVSPANGTPATTFTFTVTYTNSTGATPNRARVRFGDFSQIVLTGSGNTQAGVTYSGSTTKPNGTWTYMFRFRTNATWCETPTGTFVVATATPTPKPTPTPTPKPTPVPTAKPTPKPTAKPTPKPTAKPTPKPTRKAVATPKPSRKPRPSAKPPASPVATAGEPSPSDGQSPSPTPSPTQNGAIAIVRGTNGSPPGSGPPLDLAGLPGAVGGIVLNPFLVWLLTAAGGTALYVRLVRRRGDDAWPGGLALATATATVAPAEPAGPPPGPEDRAPIVTIPVQPPQPVSVLPSTVAARVFEKGPAKGVERATVGYHKVRISSKPDELRSEELGRLDRGDEVEILDSFEGFLQIRTPDGTVGWIQRHVTVGAPKQSRPISDQAASEPVSEPARRPSRGRPGARVRRGR